jgi:hypothetical protein
MMRKFASVAALLAVAVALGLKLMVRTWSRGARNNTKRVAAISSAALGDTASQPRVALPDHVLGHPCLYYPNFISKDVAAQVW